MIYPFTKKQWILGLLCIIFLLLALGVMLLEFSEYDQLTSRERNAYLKKHIRRYPIQGIDISQHQGSIDWESVQHPDTLKQIEFIFIRATVGSKKDKKFEVNWSEAAGREWARGAYHYYWADLNSTKQAQNFIASVSLSKGDLPPVLDIEDLSKQQSLQSLRKGLKNWIALVKEHYEVTPILYTGDRFYLDYLQPDPFFKDYPRLWIANYNNVLAPESQWDFWQFSDRLPVPGIEGDVDGNVYKGKKLSFQKLLIP